MIAVYVKNILKTDIMKDRLTWNLPCVCYYMCAKDHVILDMTKLIDGVSIYERPFVWHGTKDHITFMWQGQGNLQQMDGRPF